MHMLLLMCMCTQSRLCTETSVWKAFKTQENCALPRWPPKAIIVHYNARSSKIPELCKGPWTFTECMLLFTCIDKNVHLAVRLTSSTVASLWTTSCAQTEMNACIQLIKENVLSLNGDVNFAQTSLRLVLGFKGYHAWGKEWAPCDIYRVVWIRHYSYK